MIFIVGVVLFLVGEIIVAIRKFIVWIGIVIEKI